jgi:DNA uptake protein ComE-like DNA-binding protein
MVRLSFDVSYPSPEKSEGWGTHFWGKQRFGSLHHTDETALDKSQDAAENDAVRVRTQSTVWAILLLTILLVRSSQAMNGVQKVATSVAIPAAEARLDLNRATVDELLTIPGLTRSWAGRIVRYRPYRTKRDLLDRGIVSSQVYDRIKDYVIAHRDQQQNSK